MWNGGAVVAFGVRLRQRRRHGVVAQGPPSPPTTSNPTSMPQRAGGWVRCTAVRLRPVADRVPQRRTHDMASTSGLAGCRARQDVFHALDGPDDVLAGVGVGEAQVALAVAAERGAGEAGDAGLLQEQVGERVGGEAGTGDAREGVESALGGYALDAGELVEAGHDQVAPRAEFGEHAFDAVLRPPERREPGVL